MRVIAEQDRKPIKAWVDGVELENEALNQLRNVASMPFIFKHVAVMPDVHWGIGATVGSVIATKAIPELQDKYTPQQLAKHTLRMEPLQP